MLRRETPPGESTGIMLRSLARWRKQRHNRGMKIAFVLVAMLSTAAFAGAGSPRTVGAADGVPMWQCENNEQTVRVNDCRRQCSVEREAKRPACISAVRTCRANCAGDDVCRRNCEATANQCLSDNERNANACADACVTNGGCKL